MNVTECTLQVVKSSSGSPAISVVVTTIPTSTSTSQTACVDPTTSEAAPTPRYSQVKLVGVGGLERQNYCCGHWFPSTKIYLRHLAEKAVADTSHKAKLLEMGMVRCAHCSVWVHTENIIAHIAKGHSNIKEAQKPKMVPMGAITDVPGLSGESMLGGTNIVIKVTGKNSAKSYSSSIAKTSANSLAKPGTVKLVTTSNSTLYQKMQNMNHPGSNGTEKVVMHKSLSKTLPMVNVGPRLVMKSLGQAGVGHLGRGHKVVQQVSQPGLSSVNGVTLATNFKVKKESHSGAQTLNRDTPLKAMAPQSNFTNIGGRSLKLVKRVASEASKSRSVTNLISDSQNNLDLPHSTKTQVKKVLSSRVASPSKNNQRNKRRKQVLQPSTGDIAYTDTTATPSPTPPPTQPLPEGKIKRRRGRKPKLLIPSEGVNYEAPPSNHKGQRRRSKESHDYDLFTPKTARRRNRGIRGGFKKKRRPGRPRKNPINESPESSELDSLFDELDRREDLENEPVVVAAAAAAAAAAAKKEEENIPTVELDLFTLPSTNEQVSVLLTEPKNPNFKVYASMDAIFVGDSALGDVTNQIGYVTDANNVVYVNPSHFLFPNVEDLENFVPSPILTMKGNKVGVTAVRKPWNLNGNKPLTPIILKQVNASKDNNEANLEKSCEEKPAPLPHVGTKSRKEELVLKTTPSGNRVLVMQERVTPKKEPKPAQASNSHEAEVPQVAKEPQNSTMEMIAPYAKGNKMRIHKKKRKRRKSDIQSVNEEGSENNTVGGDGNDSLTDKESELKPVLVPPKSSVDLKTRLSVDSKSKDYQAVNKSMIQKCVVKLEELKYPLNFDKLMRVSSPELPIQSGKSEPLTQSKKSVTVPSPELLNESEKSALVPSTELLSESVTVPSAELLIQSEESATVASPELLNESEKSVIVPSEELLNEFEKFAAVPSPELPIQSEMSATVASAELLNESEMSAVPSTELPIQSEKSAAALTVELLSESEMSAVGSTELLNESEMFAVASTELLNESEKSSTVPSVELPSESEKSVAVSSAEPLDNSEIVTDSEETTSEITNTLSTEENQPEEEIPSDSLVIDQSDTEAINVSPTEEGPTVEELDALIQETLLAVMEDTSPDAILPETSNLCAPVTEMCKVVSRTMGGGLPRRMRRRRLRTKSANIVSSITDSIQEFVGSGDGDSGSGDVSSGGGVSSSSVSSSSVSSSSVNSSSVSSVRRNRRVRHASENSVLPDKAVMSEQRRVPVTNQSVKSESGHSPKRKLERTKVKVDVECPVDSSVSEQFAYPQTPQSSTDLSPTSRKERRTSASNENTVTISPTGGERKRVKKHKTKRENKEKTAKVESPSVEVLKPIDQTHKTKRENKEKTVKVESPSVEVSKPIDQSGSEYSEQPSIESDNEENPDQVRLVRERRPSFKFLESLSAASHSPKRSQTKQDELLLSPSERIPGENTNVSPVVPDLSPSREWLGRGAKLKAQVLIQDQQAGVMDSHIFPPNDSPLHTSGKSNTIEALSPKLALLSPPRTLSHVLAAKTPGSAKKSPVVVQNREWQARGAKLKAQVMISDPESSLLPYTSAEELPKPITSPPSKKIKLDLSLSPANTKDIRSFFKPGKSTQLEENTSVVSYGSPGSPQLPQSPPTTKTTKRPARNEGDIRTYFTNTTPPTPAKKIKEENARSSPEISIPEISSPKISSPKISSPKISTSKISSPKISTPKISSPKISSPKISSPKISSPTIALPESTPTISKLKGDVKPFLEPFPISEYTFEGFKRLTRQSGIRSRALLRLVSKFKMKKRTRLDKFPFPVDQLYDWDDELLTAYSFD